MNSNIKVPMSHRIIVYWHSTVLTMTVYIKDKIYTEASNLYSKVYSGVSCQQQEPFNKVGKGYSLKLM